MFLTRYKTQGIIDALTKHGSALPDCSLLIFIASQYFSSRQRFVNVPHHRITPKKTLATRSVLRPCFFVNWLVRIVVIGGPGIRPERCEESLKFLSTDAMVSKQRVKMWSDVRWLGSWTEWGSDNGKLPVRISGVQGIILKWAEGWSPLVKKVYVKNLAVYRASASTDLMVC